MKIKGLQFTLAAVFTTFAFMLSSTPRMANAQHWTLNGIHIYNNNAGFVGVGGFNAMGSVPQATLHMGDGNTVNEKNGVTHLE